MSIEEMLSINQNTSLLTIRALFLRHFNEYVNQSANITKVPDEFFVNFAKSITIPNKTQIPPLFRYSDADYYNIRNIETETLMLSNIGNMNDIFEGLSGIVDIETINNLQGLEDIAFIKSFSENANDFLMWSHYGNDFKGICVEYDFSSLNDSLLYHLFPVIYSRERYPMHTFGNSINELYEIKKANREGYYPDLYESLLDIMALFLKKSNCWEYENEWRIIATYPQIHNDVSDFSDMSKINEADVLYQLKGRRINIKGCIKRIYLGPRISCEKREHIKEIATRLGLNELYQLNLSRTKYEFEKEIIYL